MPAHALNREDAAQLRMDVIFCWHMHQPDYRLGGRYLKPWTWLHAIKDYTDMAAHLETIEGARAVINFSPVLIEQLRDYPQRIRGLLDRGEPIGDFVLDALGQAHIGLDPDLIAQLMRVNEQRMKDRFPPYARLFGKAKSGTLGADGVPDLLVWYVIAWLGESLRDLPLARRLVEKESAFTSDERRELLAFVAGVIDDLLPRYRCLMEQGAVELSVTPYAHPILPLLLDFGAAHEADPDVPLPRRKYPGGRGRCHWHLAEARRVFRDTFGAEPVGCWPSEGALSDATLALLRDHGFEWTASGSQVLHNTLQKAGLPVDDLAHLRGWQPDGAERPVCFFRDDGLSDLIGFEYSKRPAAEAVEDFITHLEGRREACLAAGEDRPVLSIIMDGENAWEYFPENGRAFLQALYSRLVAHPGFSLTTFGDALERTPPRPLPEVCAGSWVHGSLATWIGDPAKNRAWDILSGAKRAVDAALEPFDRDDTPGWAAEVLRQLAICEASDWTWWVGGANTLEDAPEFDVLFRRQVAGLYRMIGMAPPDVLDRAVGDWRDRGLGENGVLGAMRRSAGAPN